MSYDPDMTRQAAVLTSEQYDEICRLAFAMSHAEADSAAIRCVGRDADKARSKYEAAAGMFCAYVAEITSFTR